MDHAGWVDRNNATAKSLRHTAYQKRMAAQGKGPLAAPDKLTPFQARVMDIVGMVGGGIYNAPIAWDSVDWQFGSGIALIWHQGNGFSTFDFNRLTLLVFLCHEARIRCEIEVAAPRMFRLMFWQRKATGGMSERHPNLDEAVQAFREYLPTDHNIIYRETP